MPALQEQPAEPPATGETAAAAAEPDTWGERRAPLPERDWSLTSEAHLWLHSVPSGLHPKRMARMYPRIVNRLAAVWSHAKRTEALFQELLHDGRGNRQGFPPAVQAELERLHQHHLNRGGPTRFIVRRR